MRDRYGRKRLRKSFKRLLPVTTSEANPFVHLKKTAAELIFDPGIGRSKSITPALVVLNELTPTGIQLFSRNSFSRHQELALNIPSLRNFFVKTRVVSCVEVPVSAGIVHAQTFSYRVGLDFIFQSETEAEAVREYCNNLKATFLTSAA